MTNYPASIQSIPNPTSTDLLENATPELDHDYQHSTANDTIEALEAKVGVDGSAVTTSHDYKLGEVTGSDKAVGKTATQTLTNKTLTSPQINFGSDARGDIPYRNGSGATARLPIGTSGQILQANASGDPEWVANPAAADASTTTKGVSEEATQAETDARTTAGGTSARLFVNPSTLRSTLTSDYVADTGSSTAYAIAPSPAITAYTTGQAFVFKATNTNTSTTPTLNVNSLGTKTIVSIGGSTIMIGAILTGGIYQVVYDGTNFQLLNPTRYQEFIFNSGTSTWTCPRGVSTVLVDIVAGGGGGGHNANNDNKSYGGGGGGAGATNVSSSVTALTAYSVVVGAGGAGATTAGNTGTTGGTSSFNGISKTGGAGGTGSATGTSAGGAAGDSSAGAGGNGSQSSSTAGQNGQTGTGGGTGGTGGAVSGSMSGGGGGGASGIGGPAGGAGGSGIGGSGQAGVGYGTGGGGGANQGQGGNGAGGLVIIKVPMNQYI